MGIGVSIFLIAVGAILTFATDFELSGLNVDVVGVILMIVGALGLIWTLLIWGPRQRRASVVEEQPVMTRRRVYEDEPPL
jgi:Domain of unknown function (DUF6458)